MAAIFNKIIAFFMAILAFFGLTSSGTHEKPQVTGDGYGYSIKEQTVEFSFDANSTTGYSWTYSIDGDALKFNSKEYVASSSKLMGAGGTQYISFDAVKEGTATITFSYAQHWAGGEQGKTLKFVCAIDADLGITVVSAETVTQAAA